MDHEFLACVNCFFNECVRLTAHRFGVDAQGTCPRCASEEASKLTVEIREAIELCLEVKGQEPSNLEFIGIHRVTIAA